MIIKTESVVQYTLKIDILERLHKYHAGWYMSIRDEIVDDLKWHLDDFFIRAIYNTTDVNCPGHFIVIPRPGFSIDEAIKIIQERVDEYEIEDYFD